MEWSQNYVKNRQGGYYCYDYNTHFWEVERWTQFYEESRMMHVVPDTLKTSVDPNNPLALLAPLSPSYSPPSSPFDFDIDVLTPNLEIPSLLTLPANSGEEDQRKVNLHVNSNQDCCYSPITSLESSRQVPTSPSIFSLESDVLSPTMFSPSGEKEHKYPHSPPGIIKGQTGNRHRFAPQSSPYSLVPGSPVTPVGRPIRRQSSTDSGKTVVSVASSSGSGCLSLQESLNEYAEIQMKVKLEQESKESNKTLLQELGIKSTDSGGSVQNPTIAKQETPMLRKALEDQNNDFMKNASEDPVISLAMEQVQRDIKTTSEILSISTNPNEWSSGDVGRWITWHQHQYNISNPVFNPMASEDGLSLSKMSEYEFSKRFREGGDVMFAQYDIWRTAASDCSQQLLPRQENVVNESIPEQPPKSDLDSAKDFGFNSCALDMLEGQRQVQHHDPGYNPNGFTQGSLTIIPSLSNNSIYQQPPEMLPKPLPSQTLSDTSAMKPDYDPITVTKFEDVKPQIHQPPPSYDESIMSLPNIIKQYPASSSLSISPVSGSSASVTLERIPPPPAYPNQYPDPRTEQQQQINDELDDDEENDDDGKFCETQATCSRSSSNIHLWQFIKELLLQPESHSSCICWVDRERGIFKIVDSVRVATLWGKRKNRPAMNYDKLSRSLRQYYKKGIMKKTERTQRLVYQFCHPYHL